METEDEHQHTLEDHLNEPEKAEPNENTPALSAEAGLNPVIPGIPDIPVVRSNTPRPFSFQLLTTHNGQPHVLQTTADALAAFPREAPSAPPVPEEVNEPETDVRADEVGGSTPLPLATSFVGDGDTAQEFIWLFEYGLEMDSAVLNAPERLHNLAFLYGPAVLKGYQLAFAVDDSRQEQKEQRERVVATIVPSSLPGAEVWGIVYRIPRRLTESQGGEPARLDQAHDAVPPASLFERMHVTVYETYRGRELSCITYVALPSTRSQTTGVPNAALAQRLLKTIRKHQLPDDYAPAILFADGKERDEQEARIDARATHGISTLSTLSTLPTLPVLPAPLTRAEQNTEPLPVVMERPDTPLPDAEPRDLLTTASHHVGLIVFAGYLVVLLLAALSLAIVQGLGIAGSVFNTSFMPLNVPWYIPVYGLIGGSVSCLVMLGRQRVTILPMYALLAWYMRPLIGCVLAMMVYLLLNSGLFATVGDVGQHVMLFSLLSSIAGYGEGWLFFRHLR